MLIVCKILHLLFTTLYKIIAIKISSIILVLKKPLKIKFDNVIFKKKTLMQEQVGMLHCFGAHLVSNNECFDVKSAIGNLSQGLPYALCDHNSFIAL